MDKINSSELSNEAISELTEAAFNFWFNNNGHIRSPFPAYIQNQLKSDSEKKFKVWIESINEKAKKDINDEIIAEKLEEIIFETGIDLVKTEDEKITIHYPFLPRINDPIVVKDVPENTAESTVTERSIVLENEIQYLLVKFQNNESSNVWETKFELPK